MYFNFNENLFFSGPLKRFKPQLIMMDWQHEILQ